MAPCELGENAQAARLMPQPAVQRYNISLKNGQVRVRPRILFNREIFYRIFGDKIKTCPVNFFTKNSIKRNIYQLEVRGKGASLANYECPFLAFPLPGASRKWGLGVKKPADALSG